jgi:hypothetical protein
MREIDINSLTQIIEFHNLRSKSRKRNLVYKRSFLCRTLRDMNFTLSFIGNLISKDHATVINALKVYEENVNYIDFVEYIGELPIDIEKCFIDTAEFATISKKKISIIEHQLLKTTKYGDFIKLKQELIKLISDKSI